MLRAIIRFLFFVTPISFMSGLSFILFDNEEVIGTALKTQERRNPLKFRQKVLKHYLERCYKQVHEGGADSTQPPNDKKE